MTNYFKKVDGKLISQGNLIRGQGNAFSVPTIIAERLGQKHTTEQLTEVLNIPEDKKDNVHWNFQRNFEITKCFMDVCRMIQIGHKGYFSKADICDSLIWLLQQPSYVAMYSWFDTDGRALKDVVSRFVSVMIANVMFTTRKGLDLIPKTYYLDEHFQIKERDTVSLMELHDRNVNGKPVAEYRLTEAAIQYLQVVEDTERYEEFAINFDQLQEQLKLDLLNPGDLLFQIRNAIQKLAILTRRVEEAYENFVKNISSKTVESFFSNLNQWLVQATHALDTGQANLDKLKEKVSDLQLKPENVTEKTNQKIEEWLDCQEEQQRYVADLSQNLDRLSELMSKAVNPTFSNFKGTDLRQFDEVFDTSSLTKAKRVFETLSPIFLTKKKNKQFNFEVLFSSTPKVRVKKAKRNELLSKQALTSDQKQKAEKRKEEKDSRTLKLIKDFLVAFDEAIEPISKKKFVTLYQSNTASLTNIGVGQRLSSIVIENKKLNRFFNFEPSAFRKILQALTLYDTTIPLKDVALSETSIGFNKATISHCMFELKLNYFYIFRNPVFDDESMLLTSDDRQISNLIVAKVKKEDVFDGVKRKNK